MSFEVEICQACQCSGFTHGDTILALVLQYTIEARTLQWYKDTIGLLKWPQCEASLSFGKQCFKVNGAL